MKKKLVILTGAGMSAESGLQTFRDADGLWEGHSITDVATPEAWSRNPELVLEFYNQRRRQLLAVTPNQAHYKLVEFENYFDVIIVTQNVDDLHERAGSKNVIHLHGELFKVRSTKYSNLIYEWKKDLSKQDVCEKGFSLRPHIVWFGEAVPKIEQATEITSSADVLVIIGTSLQVYPAAGLLAYAPSDIPVYYIDPNPKESTETIKRKNLQIISMPAVMGTEYLWNECLGKK